MKKVTLFFDRTLREALAKNPREWTVGYRAALEFLGKLIAFGSDPYAFGTGEGCPHNYPNGAGAYLCCEGNWVKEFFSKAHRVEACLTLRYNPTYPRPGIVPTVSVELNAFRSGEQELISYFLFGFHQKTGTMETAEHGLKEV